MKLKLRNSTLLIVGYLNSVRIFGNICVIDCFLYKVCVIRLFLIEKLPYNSKIDRVKVKNVLVRCYFLVFNMPSNYTFHRETIALYCFFMEFVNLYSNKNARFTMNSSWTYLKYAVLIIK